MQIGRPSTTARGAAAFRAAHQELEDGRVFHDPLALRILAADADDPVLEAAFHPGREDVRLSVAARARFAEDAVAAAVARGIRQAVALGAGLDTFGCRNPYEADGLRVFEVDHPATQEWKRDRLAAAEIPVPPSLTFAPVDFERQGLADGLTAAGFDAARPAFFIWLGVVPYLTHTAVLDTLGFIAGLPDGSGVVFDYGEPPDVLPPEQRAVHEARAEWAAKAGEPFLSFFTPEELGGELRRLGFSETEDIRYRDLAARYESGHRMGDEHPDLGAHVIHTWSQG
ncbi:SAM-dependent methyltransferase [Streptomyces sp. SID8361]|uniref:class I SAM-dependent methyltransferase n=1 Tax=Streptomyces sp. MnatMP-M27 TaxID=1839768 RepID=UPI00081D8A11|nr:SAM-dependent methyltransferase [Streptomyces sp. MnatMP-M27]MYU14630.1 SAM-dependent methyltransferase [Streptomyces sp. SID8361]SCG06763.1 methyltransferase, TIGR00027 family [Streptomyces sp. MnatMP-M27]